MPIIKNKNPIDLSAIRAKVNPELLGLIENYCQWAGIYEIGYFFEKAARELLSKDLEWQLHLKQHEAQLAPEKSSV